MGHKDIIRDITVSTFPSALEHPVVSYQGKEGFLPSKSIQMEAFSHSQELLRWLWIVVKKGLGSGCIPGKLDHLVGSGDTSCSHVQGTADCHLWGQEWIFSPGPIPPQTGTGLREFFAFLCSTEQSPLPGLPRAILGKFLPAALATISGCFFSMKVPWVSCSEVRKELFPPGYTGTDPQGFFALLGHIEHISKSGHF